MEKAKAKIRQPILLVDDDDIFRSRLMRALNDRGWESHGAANCADAVAVARSVRPGRVVVDLRMPGESGLEVVRQIKAIEPDTAIIVLTGYGSIASATEAIRLGARDYLTKPADADQILAAFENLPGGTGESEPGADKVPSLARVEWEHIQRVLSDCAGNVSQAARVLGIHRRSLQRKLAKFAPPD